MDTYYQVGQGRLFLQPYGAGPGRPVAYQGCAAVGGITKEEGDRTPITCPSPSRYDEFVVVGTVRGEGGLPTTSIRTRLARSNPLLTLSCPMCLHVHYGTCELPSDFNGGWSYGLILHQAAITSRSTEDLTALEEGDRAAIVLSADITAEVFYQLQPVIPGEVGTVDAANDVMDVLVYDNIACGECGVFSDGTKYLYALLSGRGLYTTCYILQSTDGGATWTEYDITTLGAAEEGRRFAVVGTKLVVVSPDVASMHYAEVADLTNWTEVTEGFITMPQAIFSLSPSETWIVGDNGYIYFAENVETGVCIQDSGVAAVGETLLDIHAVNSRVVVAVGENNTVVYSENGGRTWAAVTGPDPTFDVTAVWARSEYCWIVGTGLGSGKLYFTNNKGVTWTQIAVAGMSGGEVTDVKFSGGKTDCPVGWLSYNVAGPEGRVYRTIDGGNSWYVIPEGQGTIPDNDGITAVAPADTDVNFVLAGGVNGAGGYLMIAAG